MATMWEKKDTSRDPNYDVSGEINLENLYFYWIEQRV